MLTEIKICPVFFTCNLNLIPTYHHSLPYPALPPTHPHYPFSNQNKGPFKRSERLPQKQMHCKKNLISFLIS